MDVSLPQHDPHPERRVAGLEQQRSIYGYDHDYLPPLAISQGFPRAERFSLSYLAKRVVATRALIPNTVAAWLGSSLRGPSQPQDFARLFVTLTPPPSVAAWRDDGFFAHQRLAGPNPMRIRCLGHPDELPFAVGEGGVGARIPGTETSIEDAIKSGTLFLSDYSALASIGGGEFRGLRRYLPAPRALFHWRGAGPAEPTALQPVAIEVTPGGAVRTPTGTRPTEWLAAKLCVQIADANDLELGSHLARTHLVMEPFAIATPRHLAAQHPIHRLLAPHLRFLIANTRLGRVILMKPGSLSDQLCGGTRAGSLEIVTSSYRGWSLDGHALPADLESRGLQDPGVLENFRYREDGLLLWQAIHRFVSGYLRCYYPEPRDLGDDAELQAWAAELAAGDGGRVKGMPSRITELAPLADLLTMVLFTSGPQHALVNYGQYPYLGFVANMPLAAYCDVSDPFTFESETDLMRLLPPARWARRQLQTMDLLSAYQYDRFGHYPRGHFGEPAAAEHVTRFQQRLAEIETTIDERNRDCDLPYDFLRPSKIPNSISI